MVKSEEPIISAAIIVMYTVEIKEHFQFKSILTLHCLYIWHEMFIFPMTKL